MKTVNKIISLVSLSLLTNVAVACTATTQPLLPNRVDLSIDSGSSPVGAAVQLSLTCGSGESYSISTSQSAFISSLSSTPGQVEGAWFRDPSFTLPLYGNMISGTGSGSAAFVTTLYARMSGASGGAFSGTGSYSLQLPATIVSSGASPITLTLNESGIVKGVCSIGNSVAVFNNVLTGTNPVLPVGISLNCTAGIPWTLTQPTAGTVTIGNEAGNTAWLYSNSLSTSAINITPLAGTGLGRSQIIPTYAGLSGSVMNSPIVGRGVIKGLLTYLISY